MALSNYPAPAVIGESTLEGWKVIGSGGFGQIYKARHRQWGCDVAIKLLHYDNGSSLLREVKLMRQGSSPYVIQVLGVFQGQLPSSGSSARLGLVMEFMERGSLASLQDILQGPPSLPLAFRLTHQVALGINFLHSLSPALLHLDLKPSNVLLDSSLNAKLTDFGLARIYCSVTRASKKDSDEEGGTISYMPPEAFDVQYSPTRASDIYSYGILLWSIMTGKQPYAYAMSSMVRLRIPKGDRPSLDEIQCQAAGRAGLTELMELMERCWKAERTERPSALECTTVTEKLYEIHKDSIFDAVHQVLKKLDQKEEDRTGQVQRVSITQASVSARVEAVNLCDNVRTGRGPIQEMAGGWSADQRDEAKVKDLPSPQPVCDQTRSSSNYKVKASSVHPIEPSPPSTSTRKLPQGRSAKNSLLASKESLSSQYQRQVSSPDTLSCRSPSGRGFCMYLSNVTGFQNGNNNTMYICTRDPSERRRHQTAPSTLKRSPPH